MAVNKIEIQGIENIKRMIAAVPVEMRPFILRGIATKPAQRAASKARTLQPIGDTGQMARTIGVLKVKQSNQPFVEVGYKGRSLGHIYTSRDRITRFKRGTIRGFPWLFKRAGEEIAGSAKREMTVDLTRVFKKAFKR